MAALTPRGADDRGRPSSQGECGGLIAITSATALAVRLFTGAISVHSLAS